LFHARGPAAAVIFYLPVQKLDTLLNVIINTVGYQKSRAHQAGHPF